MTHKTLSVFKTSISESSHAPIKFCFAKMINPINEPIKSESSVFFVVIAITNTNTTGMRAMMPYCIENSPCVFKDKNL